MMKIAAWEEVASGGDNARENQGPSRKSTGMTATSFSGNGTAIGPTVDRQGRDVASHRGYRPVALSQIPTFCVAGASRQAGFTLKRGN